MTSRARVVILKMGSAHPDVVSVCGDYEDWFIRVLELHPRVDAFAISVQAAWERRDICADALLLTGSRHSVYDQLPWREDVMRRVDSAIAAGTGVFGVCFGHQLLATMFGGRVERNPLGLSMGKRQVTVTPDGRRDPLYRGAPARFEVQETHGDVVAVAPPGARLLVTSSHDPHHGFRLADRVWTVQFHPEMGDREARAVERTHAQRAAYHTLDRGSAPRPHTTQSEGVRILHRFVDTVLFPSRPTSA